MERTFGGPARVAGSAGTGKTIVALHRAVFLARANPEARVLLTTFSDALANALRARLRSLISNEPKLADRLEVHSMNTIGRRLYQAHFGSPKIAANTVTRQLLDEAASSVDASRFSISFLQSEWEQIVDAWQLETWESNRDVARLGRKTRLKESVRASLWQVFERVQSAMKWRGLVTYAQIFDRLATKLAAGGHPPFEFAVIDEAQDVSVTQLRFLAALGSGRPNALFFAGDLGQRIFQQPFSWKAFGVDVRGRSSTLRINYRTSHQIRRQADRLLGPEVSDVDGNREDRRGTASTFNGPAPDIQVLDDPEKEIAAVGQWLTARAKEGVVPHEIGVFVRSDAEMNRARKAVESAKLPYKVLGEDAETVTGRASISTMHLAKGLEFRTVVVMACDDEVIPQQARIESVPDDGACQ